MRGDLSETSAAEACRVLAARGATGVLRVEGPEAPGAVGFRAGRIVGATSPVPGARLLERLVGAGLLDGASVHGVVPAAGPGDGTGDGTDDGKAVGTAHGQGPVGSVLLERALTTRDTLRLFAQEETLDALCEVLRWRFGSFSFHPAPDTGPAGGVALEVDDVLVEVTRRRQVWEAAARVIGDLDAVPARSRHHGGDRSPTTPDEATVLEAIDGVRSVRVLALELGYGEFELTRIVHWLVERGLVGVRLPEDEIGAALDDAFAYVPDEPAPPAAQDPAREPPTPPAAPHDTAAGRGPSLSEALRELRGLDGSVADDARDQAAETAEPAESRRPSAGGPTTSSTAEAVPADPSDRTPHAASGVPADPVWANQEGEVSELLRELSRLAGDEEDESPPPPRSSNGPPRRPPPSESGPKPKRRGLFGRG